MFFAIISICCVIRINFFITFCNWIQFEHNFNDLFTNGDKHSILESLAAFVSNGNQRMAANERAGDRVVVEALELNERSVHRMRCKRWKRWKPSKRRTNTLTVQCLMSEQFNWNWARSSIWPGQFENDTMVNYIDRIKTLCLLSVKFQNIIWFFNHAKKLCHFIN